MNESPLGLSWSFELSDVGSGCDEVDMSATVRVIPEK